MLLRNGSHLSAFHFVAVFGEKKEMMEQKLVGFCGHSCLFYT